VAFNVNLHTSDLEIAKRIARSVRYINGGYRHVRAMGFALEDRDMVQVSMNMTNYTRTPLPRVLETIRDQASRYGVAVAGTEIVGPVPLGAIDEIIKHLLQAHDFSLDQIIETALIG
jgi:glutamate formiminotransferase